MMMGESRLGERDGIIPEERRRGPVHDEVVFSGIDAVPALRGSFAGGRGATREK
jgi:hypothetical protein